MADVDEDSIPQNNLSEPDDLEDETQDFRFLSQLTSLSRTGQTIIPKRGTKDFEPNPTKSQASSLDASRLAMHTALSAVRIHAGKTHIAGQYLPEEVDWKWDELEGFAGRHGRCVVVKRFKSTHLKVMGVADRNNWVWFLPEEALWLLERGSLDIRWPDVDSDAPDSLDQLVTDQEAQEDRESVAVDEAGSQTGVGELPMSLQGAYASFIGKDGLTLEHYAVYAGLKRAGYIVQRAPTWHDLDPSQANQTGVDAQPADTAAQISTSCPRPSTSQPRSPISNIAAIVHRLVSYLFRPRTGESCPSLGPIIGPGLYRNYADIFRTLSLIPYHDTSTPMSENTPSKPEAPYRIHFHVWKPSVLSTYKKSSPPPPDYKICVIDARSTPSIPFLSQIGPLLDSQEEDALSREKAGRLETRIKHGRRNVLLAVVDMGIVSYLRLSDACFGMDKLFEEKAKGGTKGKRPGPRPTRQQRKPGDTR